ncbi:MAG TPA: tetratricopeptide repeat protein [Steroidobacteraceae bacterium]|nr:tetratricopeptide repeat protein [Steroidobacteraceae bacterium]
MNALPKLILAAALILSELAAALPPIASAEPQTAGSNTVIGPNVMLADGADALMRGEWQRGIQLTQMGLTFAISQQDRASALANLCAGFAALKQYQRALEHCDQSIALVDDNWRTWQNRAAAHLGLGKIEESLRDIQRGLQLNPDSDSLQKTLAIVRDHEKLQQERMRHLLES